MRLEVLAAMNEERSARRAFLIITPIDGGETELVRAEELAREPWASRPLGQELADLLRLGASRTLTHEGARLFVTAEVPPVRVVVIGAVHISQALVPILKTLGLDMIVIDPRTAFATEERFAGVRLLADWPEEVLPGLKIDPFTAVLALTHDAKIDDPALLHALSRSCFYIGALGSRKTHAGRLVRLAEAGASADSLSRIHAPIGLDIGAVSPAEIAVSIAAQIIATLRRPSSSNSAGERPAVLKAGA